MSDSDVESVLAAKFARLLPHLNERQRRLAVAAEVAAVGRGGVSAVARASGLSRPTVYRGLAELDEPAIEPGWAREPGGGRKRLVQTDPGLVEALEALIGPSSRGDPGSPLQWTTKSTWNLADALRRHTRRPDGYSSPPTPAGPTATGAGCGRRNWASWPRRPLWRSLSAISPRVPASGTRSSIACSARSRRTGETSH